MRKNLSVSSIIAVLALSIVSCGAESSEDRSSSGTSQFELIKTDSIRIDKLETVQITDYNSENQQFLAFATSTKKCLELDMEGNILSEVDLTGEGPGHFGRGMTELGYFSKGKTIHGPAQYFTYDKDWDYTGRVVYDANGYSIPVRYIDGAPVVIQSDGKSRFVRIINHNMQGHIKLATDYFDKANMIKLLGTQMPEQPLLAYPENSIYRRSESYYADHRPVISYNSSQNTLALALPLEQKLYRYDVADNFKLLETIELDLTNFNTNPRGLSYEDQHKNSLSDFGRANELNYVYGQSNSLILKLYSHGDLTMVVHKTGFSDNSITSYREALKKARAESKTITTFFVSGKKVYETDVQFPRMVLLSNRQFIVPNINDEVERDYNLYDIYSLSEKIKSR